jgi:serine/threonine protein kinase
MRDLKHINLINLKECFEGDTSFYMIMDLMKGNTLENYLRKHYYHKSLPHDSVKIIIRVEIRN